MSSSVLLDTLGQKTNSLAYFWVARVGYTFIDLKFKTYSSEEATYRITHGNPTDSKRSYVGPEIKVAKKGDFTAPQTGLIPGSTYYFFLERKENGQWVEQSGPSGRKYAPRATYKTTVSSSTSTTAALLTWPTLSTSDHRVDIYDAKATNGVKRLPIKTFASSSVKTSGQTATVTVTGLKPDKVYYASVMVKEPTRDGTIAFVAATADEIEFETSDRANLTIDPAKTFCSSVTMSWDKGGVGASEADKKADFFIQSFVRDGEKWKAVSKLTSRWTTEGNKTFTPKGLEPGKLYRFILYRLGVDGRSVGQMSAEVTTKTTDMTLGSFTSTGAFVNWEPVYDKADYSVRYTAEDGKGSLVTRGAGIETEYYITRLIPNTSYNVELVVKEHDEYHTLAKGNFTTQKAAILTENGYKNTSVNLEIETFHADSGRYYVRDITGKLKTAVFTIAKVGKTSVVLENLVIGRNYKLMLLKVENKRWVYQKWDNNTKDYIMVQSNDFLVSTSVAPQSALVTWDQTQKSEEYTVQIFDKVPAANVAAKFTFSGDKIETADGEHTVVIPGLVKKTKYYGIISGNEKDNLVKLKEFDFVTSSIAALKIGKYFSSYANVSWIPGDIGEADGVAEYHIRYYNYSTKKWSPQPAWQPHTNNTAVISGLSPGVKYFFSLQRLGVDGKSRREAGSAVTMRTTKLEVESVGSGQIDVTWASVYPNAQYQLAYTQSGGKPVLFGKGPFTETSASIGGLAAGTDYKIDLSVIENSQPVGVATASLGTAAGASSVTKTSTYSLIAAILAIVAILVAVKMRKRM